MSRNIKVCHAVQGSPCVLLMSIINPDGIELIGRVLFCLLWRKCGMDKPFGKLGPSSSSSCSTLSPSFDYHCTPQIITSTQTSVPKVHYYYYLKVLLLSWLKLQSQGSSRVWQKRVKTHLAFNQNPYHLMSATTELHSHSHVSIACFSNLLSVG